MSEPPSDPLGPDPRAGSPVAEMLGRAALHARLGLAPEPTMIGRYELLERLGQGGMGVVVAARDTELDRRVALKLLNLRDDRRRVTEHGRTRLVREARSLAKLSHPNIVQVYEAGEHDGVPYLTMELVRGGTLRDWLAQAGDRVAVLEMFLAIGEGLAAAHEAGIVHRDFKPDNVLVGEDGRPRIADFGLAALERAPEPPADASPADGDDILSLTRTGAILGTPAYMSPEQWRGQPTDARSDQFAYCVALHEALYGVRPFFASSPTALRERVLLSSPDPVAPGDRAPAELHAAILRGLASDPAARWPDLDPLLSAIRQTIAMTQPGMFSRSPLPVVRAVAPLLILIPVVWAGLELAGVVEYRARSWLFVSIVQLVSMVLILFPLRLRLLAEFNDRRVIAMPTVLLPLLLAHRGLVLATGGSVEQMFAYDFLTIAAAGAAVTLLVERGLWPMIVFCLALATFAGLRPAWAGHLWLVFSLCAPLVVGTAGARAVQRRSQGDLSSPKKF